MSKGRLIALAEHNEKMADHQLSMASEAIGRGNILSAAAYAERAASNLRAAFAMREEDKKATQR